MMILTWQRWSRILSLLGIVLIGMIVLAALWGSEPLSWSLVFSDDLNRDRDIFFLSRLPRVLTAVLVGMALGSAGAAFQGLLRNPLADPYLLGVSSGAALGSIVSLALGMVFPWISLIAFASALAATLLVYGLATYRRRLNPETLLLTGVIFNAFAFSFILIINALATVEQSHQMLFFLIGSVDAVPYRDLAVVSALVGVGVLLLAKQGRPLNVLAESPEQAASLGLDPRRHQLQIFFAASLVVGAVVSLVGLVGFVGLFTPHVVRLLWGPDHRLLVPASALVGAIVLLFCDGVARTIGFAAGLSSELPVGAITAVIGSPCFIVLLRKLK